MLHPLLPAHVYWIPFALPGCPCLHVPCHVIPTFVQTVDRWASSTSQCIIPGNEFPLFPYTYSMNDVCDRKVVTLDLVDLNTPQGANPIKVGILYVFKDYSDNMYVTVSLNSTWTTTVPGYSSAIHGGFQGQYLHVQPSLDSQDSGRVWVWDNLGDLGVNTIVQTAYNNMLQADGTGGM